MSENKNALLAIVLSIIIIMLFEVLYSGSERDNDLESEITEDASSISETEITKSAENHQNEPKIPIKSMCVGYIRGLGRFLRIFLDFFTF